MWITPCPRWAMCPSSAAVAVPPPARSTAGAAGAVATRPKTVPARAKPVKPAPREAATAAPTTPVGPIPARMPRRAPPPTGAESPGPVARVVNTGPKVASAVKVVVAATTGAAAVARPAKAKPRQQLVRLRPGPSFSCS